MFGAATREAKRFFEPSGALDNARALSFVICHESPALEKSMIDNQVQKRLEKR
jgi:hypothetical protein